MLFSRLWDGLVPSVAGFGMVWDPGLAERLAGFGRLALDGVAVFGGPMALTRLGPWRGEKYWPVVALYGTLPAWWSDKAWGRFGTRLGAAIAFGDGATSCGFGYGFQA